MTQQSLSSDWAHDESGDAIEKRAPRTGASRVLKPNRGQIEMRLVAPDGLIPVDHPARGIVDFVEKLDLARFEDAIQAKEGQPGRPAIDPALLLSVWVYHERLILPPP